MVEVLRALGGRPRGDLEGLWRGDDGLDVSGEIRAVASQDLGDTVLLRDDSGLAGFAVCHRGAGTEAGSGACYVKFRAIRPGPEAGRDFERLMDACEAFAAAEGMQVLIAGANMGRHEAYRALLLAASASRSRASRCIGQTDPATTGPTSTS